MKICPGGKNKKDPFLFEDGFDHIDPIDGLGPHISDLQKKLV